MYRFFIRIVLCSLVIFGMCANVHAAGANYDEMGRLLNPEEAFYNSNPPAKGEARKPIREIDAYTTHGFTQLSRAADYGDLAEVKRLLKLGADPNIRSAGGYTALEKAAARDKLEIAELLLANGAKATMGFPLADSKSEAMKTLLTKHGATASERPKPPKTLRFFSYAEGLTLNKIVEEEERSGKMSPSVTVAAMRECPPAIITQLIKEGGDINEVHPVFGTPLNQAIEQRNELDFIAFLLKVGADPNLTGKALRSPPLYKAIGSRRVDLVQLLLEAGARVKSEDPDNRDNVLQHAIRIGNVEIARLLIKAGADPNGKVVERNGVRENPILIKSFPSYYSDPHEMMFLMLEAGADPNVTDKEGRSALHVGVDRGNIKIVKALLEAGAKVNARDPEGRTPLFLAVKNRDLHHLVEPLLDAGADPRIKNKEGKNALDIAEERGDTRLLQLLRKKAPKRWWEKW